MKLKHIAIIGSLFPILFSLVLFFGVLISADSDAVSYTHLTLPTKA